MKKTIFCLLCLFFLTGLHVKAEENVETMYQGNIKSMIYHKKGCRYYGCKTCTVNFETWQEAEQAGFVPCKRCIELPHPPDDDKREREIEREKERERERETETERERLAVSKAISNILETLLIVFMIEVGIFILFNCFVCGKLGLLERWNRFQGWLFCKNTKLQLKDKLDQAVLEEKKLDQTTGIKKFFLETWYITRDFFIWLHRFTGCLINLVLLTSFTVVTWDDCHFLFHFSWKWIKTTIGQG